MPQREIAKREGLAQATTAERGIDRLVAVASATTREVIPREAAEGIRALIKQAMDKAAYAANSLTAGLGSVSANPSRLGECLKH